jgi:hypothetical protein
LTAKYPAGTFATAVATSTAGSTSAPGGPDDNGLAPTIGPTAAERRRLAIGKGRIVWINGRVSIGTGATPVTGVPRSGLLVRVIGAGTVYLGGSGVTTGGDTGGGPLVSGDGWVTLPPPPPPTSQQLGVPEDPGTIFGVVAEGTTELARLAVN